MLELHKKKNCLPPSTEREIAVTDETFMLIYLRRGE